jgi:ABC-type amino acid transport substrate-binding protein
MPTIKDFVKHSGKNRFKISGPMFDWQVYGFALKKNSPYRKLINEHMVDFMRTGAYWDLHKKWFGD